MKKGAIICITGKAPEKWTENDEKSFRKKLHKFDTVELVTPQIFPSLMQGICLRMLTKGITDLFIAVAVFSKTGKLKLSEIFKLPMIGMS